MTATTSPGAAGSTVQRPTSVDEAAKVLRDSRGSVLFRGAARRKMSWAGRPEDLDLVLETGGLDRLLDHNPADMTASAQARHAVARPAGPARRGRAVACASTRRPNPTERPWAGCSPPASPAPVGCGTARCVTW